VVRHSGQTTRQLDTWVTWGAAAVHPGVDRCHPWRGLGHH